MDEKRLASRVEELEAQLASLRNVIDVWPLNEEHACKWCENVLGWHNFDCKWQKANELLYPEQWAGVGERPEPQDDEAGSPTGITEHDEYEKRFDKE